MDGQAAPDYRLAMDALKSRIQSGSIAVGSLVTIRQIAKIGGTTYPTARTSTERLVAEGILRPHQGKGFEVIASPEEAAAERIGTKELSQQVAELRAEARSLSAQVERIESNLEDLHDKLGYEYATDSTDERAEPAPAARRGRTG